MAADYHALARAVEGRIRSSASFSGVAGLRLGGEERMTLTRGWASRQYRRKNRIDTSFGVASVSKLFTSLAVGRLVAAGRLALDDKALPFVRGRLPELDPRIEVGHLLSHTSGMGDYFHEEVEGADPRSASSPEGAIPGADYADLWRDRPCYRYVDADDFVPLFRDDPQMFAPGERFLYNNAAFIVLGLVVEAVSGERFPDFARREVVEAAGMTGSGYWRLDELPPGCATGYVEGPSGPRANIYSIPVTSGADGGVFTNLSDLDALWEALLSGDLLGRTVTEAWKAPVVARGPRSMSCRGFFTARRRLVVEGEPERAFYFTEGDDPGYRCFSIVSSDRSIRFTIFSNGGEDFWDIVEDCLDELFGR
ncbi:MAG: serine hydrolase [Spirochaetes bacterium]|nr:serine hydrolase [Spirochaetota bacterium]